MAAIRNKVLDAIVVGAGGAHGSAALYHFAKRGAQVLGLEAQPAAPHAQGSSHGGSRIIRMAYFEHPSYVPLLRDSFRQWRELEAASGQKLLTMTGCLNASTPGAQGGPGLSCYDGALLAAKEHGLEHELLSAQQVAQRFPACRLPPGFQTLYEPQAGFLAPEKCIEALLSLAQEQHGAQLMCGAKVLGWRVVEQAGGGSSNVNGSGGGALVEVRTSCGTFSARRLVLAGGAWMPQLVPELAPLLTVERQVVGWFSVSPQSRRHFTPANFPVFLLQDDLGYWYGFPEDEHGFKFGRYNHRHETGSADSIDRAVSAEDEALLRQCVTRYFPGADGTMAHASVCLFTNTPDQQFILDRHPRHPEVVLCSACSGHGFKFAPTIGSILADLALEGTTQQPIGLHRLSPQRPGQAAVLEAFRTGGGGGGGS